jgi:hypothetical protein
MANENNLKQELLKQMENDSSEAVEIGLNSGSRIIEKYKTQLKRRKWIAVAGWFITILYAIAMHNLKVFLLKHNISGVLTSNEFWLIRRSDTCLMVLIIIALLLTYLYYSTSRTITILQISARLAKIEEHLKRMSQDK